MRLDDVDALAPQQPHEPYNRFRIVPARRGAQGERPQAATFERRVEIRGRPEGHDEVLEAFSVVMLGDTVQPGVGNGQVDDVEDLAAGAQGAIRGLLGSE